MASGLAAGFLLGFAIAVSPGPIFFLVLRRTLERGVGSGLASGAGVACADGLYALVAAFGVGAVATLLAEQGRWLTAAGGVALIAVGGRTLLSRPAGEGTAVGSPAGPAADYASTLALTLANPQTILAFAAVVAGAGALLGDGGRSLVAVVLGVLLGSAAWWVVLAVSVALLRERIGRKAVRGLTLLSGLAILAFGVAAVIRAAAA